MPPAPGASEPVQAAEPIGFENLFNQLCSPQLTKEARRDLFAALWETPGGPFMDSHLPMRRSVKNLARHVTKSELCRLNLPASSVDHNDVAHDAIVAFLEQCHRIRDHRKLRSWFWSVMQKMVLNERGRNRPFDETSDLTLVDREQHSSIQPTDEASGDASTNPRVAALNAALGELSPSLREVVVLHGLEGHTHEEAARVLGIEPTAVRVRWLRAKRVLRTKLAHTLRKAG